LLFLQTYLIKAAVSTDNKFGYISSKGISIIAPQYDGAMSFKNDNTAVVNIKDESFVIDKAGKILREVEKYEEHEKREKK
jgi:hypothetical protein